MILYLRLSLVILVIPFLQAFAVPNNLQIWFLSADTASAFIAPRGYATFDPRVLTAQAPLQCQKMGEYCFDPQVGLYSPGSSGEIKDLPANYESVDKLEDYSEKRKALGSEWSDSKCDESDFFSLFCSKGSSSKASKAKLEIWIDTSSTMKQVDFKGHDQVCDRLSLLNHLESSCRFNQDYKLYIFNEVKKEAGQKSQVCLNSGLNHRDRLIKEIKASNAKNLVIITDIFEADSVLIDFVEAQAGGSVKGLREPLYAKDLKSLAETLSKQCL